MTKTEPHLTVSSIDVEGLDHDLTSKAVEEINSLLAPLSNIPLDLNCDVVLSVLITDQLSWHVDRIQREFGTFVHPHHCNKDHGVVAGITLTAPDTPPLRTTLVLHNGMWARSDARDVVSRVYMLGYTLGHALLKGREKQKDVTDKSTVRLDDLEDMATDLIAAFDADCTALALCQFLQSSDGNAVECWQWLGSDFVDTAAEQAEGLCIFAAVDIQFYRVTGIGLGELYPRADMLLRQTLFMLVHAIALYATAGQWESALAVLRQSPGFRTYLLADLEAITHALTESEEDSRVEGLAIALARILARLGLRLQVMPDNGLYVHVSEPVFCNDLSSDQQ